MSHLFGGGGGGSVSVPPPPPPPPPIPAPQAPQAAQAAQSVGDRARNASGLASTIMTGPQGLTTLAQTTNKTLLGQ